MKTLKSIIIIFFFPFFLNAQSEGTQSEQTIIHQQSNETSKTDIEYFNTKTGNTHGVYLGLGGGTAFYDGASFAYFESRLSYVGNQRFEIGIGSEVFHSFSGYEPVGTLNKYAAGSVGGVHLKAKFQGNKKVHFSVPLFLGAGAAGTYTSENDDFFNDFCADDENWSPIFVIQPGVNVEFNLTKVVGAEIGVRYRFTAITDTVEKPFENLNGLSVGAMFKFGYFDIKKKQKKQIEKKQIPGFQDL